MELTPSPELSAVARTEWQVMVKRPDPVYLRQMDHDFVVETNEGTLQAHAGDYLAHDCISGHFWPISAEYVAQHYEPMPPGARKAWLGWT